MNDDDTPIETSEDANGWEGAEEWMPLAWELCAEEHGEEACSELLWEGGPIPAPWGERWLKYEDEAKRLIALVRKCTALAASRPTSIETSEAAALSDDDMRELRKAADMCGLSQEFAVLELRASQPATAPVVPATLYVEVRECPDCGHIDVNDDSDQSACNTCEWSGPSPKEDHCPGCGRDGTMTSACPECGHRTTLLAERHLQVAAAPAAPVVPQPAAQQGEADRDAEAELICAEDVLDGYAAGLDLKQTHFDCVGDYIKAVVERLRHSVDFYQRRCDLLQQWQSRMRDPERTIVCDILANAQMLPDPTGARYGAQQGEAVAPIIVRALELAMAICDRVPTRWHEVGDAHPIERDIGRMVNVQPDGSHGYRLIADALSAAKAAPPARQAVALTDEDVERLFTDPRGQTYVMAEQYDEFCAFKARTRTIERAVWQANGITPAGGEAAR